MSFLLYVKPFLTQCFSFTRGEALGTRTDCKHLVNVPTDIKEQLTAASRLFLWEASLIVSDSVDEKIPNISAPHENNITLKTQCDLETAGMM